MEAPREVADIEPVDLQAQEDDLWNLDRETQCELYNYARFGSQSIRILQHRGVNLASWIWIKTDHCDCALNFESPIYNDTFTQNEVLETLQEGSCVCAREENSAPEDTTSRVSPVNKAALNALHVAASYGNTWLVKYLIEEIGVPVNRETPQAQYSPLLLAAGRKEPPDREMVQTLLNTGANINFKCKYDTTALHEAVERGHTQVVEALCQHKSCDINATNSDGETALYLAVTLKPECVRILLTSGAALNVRTNRGWSPLLVAVREGRNEIVKMLVDHPECDLNLSGPGRHTNTALHYAVYQGDVSLVSLLLEAGADPNVKSEGGHTPLMAATYNNFQPITQTLIRFHSDVNATNDHGYTPMHLAAWDGHLEIVQYLLDAGSLHDTQTDDRNTPLALACHGNHLRVIERLLPLGCRVNNADKDKDTPLLYCAYNGCSEGVRLLMEYGAHPDLGNSVGATPLWNAVYMRKTHVVNLLLSKNVRLDAKSKGIDQHAHTDHAILIYDEPKSVLFVACHRGAFAALKLLVLAGASLNEPWLYTGSYPSMIQEDEDMRVWLNHQCHSVSSLKVLTRNFIRANNGLALGSRVKEMEIPCTLKEFLMLKYL